MPQDPRLAAAEDRLKSQLRRDLLAGLGGATALSLAPAPVLAQTMGAMGAAADSPGSLKAWSAYVDLLMPAGSVIADTLEPNSEQLRADLYRQLVMNIAQGYFWYFQSTPEHPDWMPFENSVFMLQPNPDGIYHLAPVDGAGVYRIVGNRGGNLIMNFTVGQAMMGADEPKPSFNAYNADAFTLGPNGEFEVIFSATRPAGWAGDWRYMNPGTRSIWVRQFTHDWGKDPEGRFAIERLDRPALKPRPTPADIAQGLGALLGYFVRHMSKMCIDFQQKVVDKLGYNQMELADFVDLGNSPQSEWHQRYWRCMFDYGPSEALILETELPKRVKYWNVQMNDLLWNQIEFAYRMGSLNGGQARLDADGKFRAVVALEDPGVPNWLDTNGYRRGMLIGRWNDADSAPLPTIRKVAFADIRNHLPADTPTVTPSERDKMIRARNIGVQLRRRW